MANNYLSNTDLLNEIVTWKSNNEGIENPKLTNNMGIAIIRICENLGKSGRFSGYTWKEDMVEDAIIACVKGIKNFDQEKSQNPFAFLTQIAWNAFIKRITIEKDRLVGMREYREYSTDIVYTEDEQDYSYIAERAKGIDSTYKKPTKEKRKKKNQDVIEVFMD